MADISFDVEMAKQWEREVRHELEMVSDVMLRVLNECESDPGDDTIDRAIKEDGKKLIEATKSMQNVFNQTMEGLAKIISYWAQVIQDSVDKMRQVSGRHG